MNKISEEDQGEIGNFVTELTSLAEEIDVEQDNVREAIAKLNGKIQQYNSVLKKSRDCRDGLVQQMHDHFDGKPEKWREGEEGEAYATWLEEWEGADLHNVELVEQIEVNGVEHAGLLDELPTSPE